MAPAKGWMTSPNFLPAVGESVSKPSSWKVASGKSTSLGNCKPCLTGNVLSYKPHRRERGPKNVVLLLVIYFIWKLLGGFPVLAKAYSWLRKNCRRPSFCPEISPKALSLAERFFQKVAVLEKKIVEGIKRKVFGRLPHGVAQRAPGRSLRQLLCNDMGCKVCEQAAQEASQLMSGGRAGGYSFPSFRAPHSHGPCVGRPLQLDTPDSFPQSASAPEPISRGAHLTRPASSGRPLCPPSFPAEDREQTFSVAERVSEGSRGSSHRSAHLVGQQEEVLLCSSTTHEMSQMSWTESDPNLSELSLSSWEGGKSCRCCQVPRKLHNRRRGSSWVKSSVTSQTSIRDTESFFLRMRTYSQSSPSEASRGRGRKTMARREGRSEAPRSATDPSSSRAQAFMFTAADISFVDKAVVASLESHLLGKRVQHLLGLPMGLLRSLREFMPSAPRPAPQRDPVGVTVLTVPQGLSFVAESTKKRLELHLKKMVQMKHWQLPQRAQEALRHMKPPSQPRETSAFPGTPGSSMQSCSELSYARKQQALQRNLAKRALEMQLGVAAPKIQQFRKACPQAPKPALPKIILPGLRPPEPRSQQIHFLDLPALAYIKLNITHKKLTYCLGLPSLYHRSLAQLLPDAVLPAPTFSLPRRSAAFGFTSTEIRFLCPKAREELEWHVRRRTLQHAWGLPRLVQRSLQTLLSNCPQVRPSNARAGVVSISTPELSFLSRAIQGELEKNVQKRIVHQRWMLPQRVLDSVKLLYPQGQPCAVGQQRRQKAQRMVAPAPPLLLSTQLAKTQVVLQHHVAKKSVEVNLEVFPAAVRVSWRCMLRVLWRPLPKLIHPGHKPLLPRRPLPPMAFAEHMSRIEMSVKCNHLASLWGLGTRYTEALRAMSPPGPSMRRRAAFTFSGVQVTILPRTETEALERHVSSKRLQHEWGFPVLVQRSLRYLVCEPPPLLPLRQTGVSVRILVQDLFLQQSFCNRLEMHVQKMKLQRLWGLPKRVVESLRTLWPELQATAHRQKSSAELVVKSTPRKAGPESLPVTPIVGTLCTDCRRRKAASRGFPGMGRQNLEKIRVHSAKKSMEVHWEIFPAVTVSSWRRAVLTSRQPLPKRVLRGVKPLQPRKHVLTFVLAEDAKKIEVAVQRYHLSSLWGLGQRYVEALSAMAPVPHPQPPRYRRAPLGFSQARTLFLPQEDRESLERHVRKKKLQHEWGFPVSVQSSLRAFMPAPQMPGQVLLPGASSRTKIWVQMLPGELLFLPRSTLVRLEHHIQRMKLQRQWGLPRRILESMQFLLPGKKMLPAGSSSRESSFGACAKPWTVGAKAFEPVREKDRRVVGVAAHSAKLCLPLEGMSLEKLQLHVTKKSLEVHLGASPAVLRSSRQRASLSLSQTLPRLIYPSSATLRPRSSCLLFSADQMGRIELAVKHNYLFHQWGLGTRYVEAVAAMAPRPPFRTLARRRGAAFEFLAVETSFLQRSSREELELHVRKKRIQHMWEFPALVQRSLEGFMQGPPRLPSLPKTSIQICVQHQELLFLPRGMCSRLEFHIQRRKLQRRWGLPRKVLDSLQSFLPTPPPGRALLPPSSKEMKLAQAEFSTAGGSRAADARRRKTCNVPPVKSQCMESSTRATLETHLKKKALESKFQLMMSCKAPAGSIRRAPLPKPPSLPSGVRPRRPLLPFVEQEALLKIQMNIRQKHLTCLWGLPSLQIKSLSKMYGQVPGRPLPGKVATVRSSSKVPGRETPKGPVATGLKPWRWGASFLKQEASDLLEMHVLRKKLQHTWGLPATIQKSLSAFPRAPSKLQRAPTRAVEVRVVITQRLVFLDPITAGRLEAHMKSRTATHRWGLPKLVQESVKVFLPPGSAPQADQAQTPLCTCSKDHLMPLGTGGQSLQAAGEEAQSPLAKQVESEWQLLPREGGKPSQLSPGRMHLETSRHGREAPKTELEQLPVGTTCLTDEAREYLEFHVKRKRVQHDWSLPSTVQKSLRAFAPPPPELQGPAKARAVVLVSPEKLGGRGKGGTAAHPPRSAMEVMIPRRILRFMCPNVKDCLETHVKRWATEHRWGLPQMVRRSVRAALPAQEKSSAGEKKHPVRLSKHHHDLPRRQEIHSHSEGEASPGLLHAGKSRYPVRVSKHHRDSSQQCGILSHSEGEESLALQPSKKAPSQMPKGHQRKQRPARNVGTAAEISPTLKPRFLTDEALHLLEFHTIHKRIQHAWATPSVLQKSLDALAPFALCQGEDAPKTHRWRGAEVRVVVNDLSFLKPDIKERLEAHIRTLTTRHRWEIPKRVQQSLKTFLGSRPPSRSEVSILPCQCKSWQLATDDYQTSDDDDKDSPRGTGGRRRTTKKQKVLSQGQRGTVAHGGHEESVFLFHGVRLPFLQHEAQNVLEFHIQHKKIQHAWGLPSAVLRSLQSFAPPPLESHKKRPQRKIVTHQKEGEMQTVIRSLSFLSPERKEYLNSHLRRMIEKHRWGLPERVQQSLRAFMPSRPASQPELDRSRRPPPPPSKSPQDAADSETDGGNQLASGTEGDNEGYSSREATEKPGRKLHHKREAAAAAAAAHVDVSTFFFPEVTSPFLPHETQNALEFHIRCKRLQHAWGLPSTMLKSLQAFAPLPLQPHKKRPPGKSVAHPFPWDEGNVEIMTRGLVFINSEVKERLEAHVRSLTAGHRWDLQKHAQEAMRAFQLPRPPSVGEMGLETQEAFRIRSPSQLGSSVQKRQDRQNVPGEMEVEKLLAAAPSATSATSISCERELPFLAGHLQDFLEFHIQRKKIQHDWGLPATVQRSVRAFAPVPRGLQESPLPSTGMGISAARAKGVGTGTRAGTKKGKEVQVGAKQLHFLHVGTKEHLEKHIRGLKVQHQWHVPKVAQESARAFILRAHGPEEEEEEEEQPSMYEQTLDTSDTPFKTETELESSSSWEDPRTYHTELFSELRQDSGEASWVETEEPSLCLCGRTWHRTAAQEARGGWEAGREAPGRSRLQEKPLQGSWLKKPRQVQRSRIPDRMQEPGVSPLPQPSRRPQKYVHNASRRLERKPSSQRVRYTCGRITHLAVRSSNTSLGKRRKKTTRLPWQPEGSFEGMADDSHLPPGQLPLLPKGSEAVWEHRKDGKLPNCPSPSHFLKKATAATSSSSQLAAEQKWRQQEQEQGAENGREAQGGSSSLLSEDIEQVPGPSSGESIRDASLLEQEATEADLRPPRGTESMQQSSLFAPQQALGAFLQQAYAVETQSSYEDVVARNYRMAGSIRQVKSRSGLRMGGRKVGWGREKRVDLPSQTMGDADWARDPGRQVSSFTRELGRWSSESLCQECLSLKSPSWKEGSEEDSAGPPPHQGAQGMEEGTSSDSPKDSEWQVLPASPNEGFLGAEGEFQRHLAPGLPLQTDEQETVGGREEQGTSSGSEEQHPVSMGSMSQFSTECEWEQVGDWDTIEEGFARSDCLVKEEEEEGEGNSGSNWPGAGREVMGSRRRENSPTDSHSLASQEEIPSQTALLWEASFVLSNMATESASENLSAPQQARAEEVTEGLMPLGRPPSPATSQGSGEQSRYSQFVGTPPPNEKVTLLCKILERKLCLDEGLRVLRRCGERQSKQENSGF